MLILLTGPSAVGKTTLEESLDVDKLTIYTSREKRDSDGDDYKHMAVKEIRNNTDLFVYAILSEDWIYAISKKEILTSNLKILSVITNRVAKLVQDFLKKNHIEFKTIHINVFRSVRVKRMMDRGESKESINARLDFERKDITYSDIKPDYINLNFNYHLETINIVNFVDTLRQQYEK